MVAPPGLIQSLTVPASGLYEWPKEGHAISPTYTPEPTADEAQTETVDLFGTPPPTKKTKAIKPVKRVSVITTTEPGPFAFAGIWDALEKAGRNVPRNLCLSDDGAQRTGREFMTVLLSFCTPGTTTAGSASTPGEPNREPHSTFSIRTMRTEWLWPRRRNLWVSDYAPMGAGRLARAARWHNPIAWLHLLLFVASSARTSLPSGKHTGRPLLSVVFRQLNPR